MARHHSSATPLALAFGLLVAYASLYPFTGWRWPDGSGWAQRWVLPWPAWYPRFDITSNLLGYLPLGALIFVAIVRGGGARAPAWLAAVALPSMMSYGLELLQQFLPVRVPSRLDWTLNSIGGAVGATLAVLADVAGLLTRWQSLRDRWFVRTGAGALALLLMWPVGLLFPAPVPFGLGQVWPVLRQAAITAFEGTPWSASAVDSLRLPDDWAEAWPLSPLGEGAAIAMGLLAPCLVAFAVTRPGWRRLVLVIGSVVVGLLAMTLSTAMNFGPDHALAWWTPATWPGLAAGLAAALVCLPVPRRLAVGLALVALTALVTLVAQAPADPYYALSLQGWEQGRFIRFHGLAQWIGWLWPYAAMLWLLLRLGARDDA